MIEPHFHAETGVALMQLCLMRRLAQEWSYGYRMRMFPGFPGGGMEGARRVLGPRLRWEGQWPRDAHSGRNLTQQELRTPPEACVVLAGEFQRFDLIAEVRDKVREDWLRLENPLPVREAGDLLVAVRERESVMPVDEIRALAAKAAGRVHLLTDGDSDPLLLALRDLGAEWHVAKGMEALRLAHSFQRVAFCQSALYWWGAFLGAGREIYFPKIDKGHWSHPNPAKFAWQPLNYGIDLRVPDEERWIYDW